MSPLRRGVLKADVDLPPLTPDEVEAHLREMLPRARVLPLDALSGELPVSCVDGRQSACVAGAPGGNAGLLVLLLAAWESSAGTQLDEGAVDRLFRRYLDHFGAFYLHSDREAHDRLAASLGAPAGVGIDALTLRPPEELRPTLLGLLVLPAHVGCGHLRLLLEDPEGYGVRRALVEAVLRSFFRHLWAGDTRLTFDVLGGDHREEGVLSIRTSGTGEGAAPLVTACPQHGELDLFVHHPDAVEWLHALHALFLVRVGYLAPAGVAAFIEAQERLGTLQLQRTLGHLAPGLPLFDVEVEAGGGGLPDLRSVTPAGEVPPPAGPTGGAPPAPAQPLEEDADHVPARPTVPA